MADTTMDRTLEGATGGPADRDEAALVRPAGSAVDLDHRRLVRTLVVACVAGGMWLVAQDIGFTAIGALLR